MERISQKPYTRGNHLICLICQTKASSLLWAKCWLLNHRVLKEYPAGRELHLTYAYQRLVALVFNGSISQQKLQMRSQPLNMDDELWAGWVWIIHMQRDCWTMLEWLHHSWNKGLINKYTQLLLWLPSAQASADSIAQRIPSQPFRQGDGSHLKWPVILCLQKVKVNTAGFLWCGNITAWVCSCVYV